MFMSSVDFVILFFTRTICLKYTDNFVEAFCLIYYYALS